LSEEKAMTVAALAEREKIAKQLEEEKKRLEMATTELKTGLEVWKISRHDQLTWLTHVLSFRD